MNRDAESSFKQNRISIERRQKRRYPLALQLRWKLLGSQIVVDNGTGTTINLSSGGLLFRPDKPVPEGHQVELSIAWPVALHGFTTLQLVVLGIVLRASEDETAIRILYHEFRTLARDSDDSHRERRRLLIVPLMLSSRF